MRPGLQHAGDGFDGRRYSRSPKRGGIFLYPWDARQPERAGKLRLMYEANPLGMIIEQAGGAATDGTGRILEIEPTGLHQRIAVMMGCADEVAKAMEYLEPARGAVA